MPEIIWCGFLLAIGTGVLLTYGIAAEIFHQWRQRKHNNKKTEIESHRSVRPQPVRPAVSSEPVFRGYDSPELFREDALLRIHELKAQIAAEVKKGG